MPDSQFQSTLEQRMRSQELLAVPGSNYPGQVPFYRAKVNPFGAPGNVQTAGNAGAAGSAGPAQTQQAMDGDRKPDDTSAGVGVLVVKDGQILTGTRVGENTMGGPGGHIKVGETPLDAAMRETQEEFGIRPKNLTRILQVKKWPGRFAGSTVFLCTDYDGEIHCDNVEMRDPAFRPMPDLLRRCRFQPLTMFPPFAYSLFNFLYTMIPLAGERLAEEAEREKRLSPEILRGIRQVVDTMREQNSFSFES